MSYLIELRTTNGNPTYVISHATNREEALAQLQQQVDDDETEAEIVVVAVHTVH